jgi:N,N'-diacetyllegionaminate synthase
MRTLIIAEAGVNHNGDFDLAKKMISVACEAGADFIKFQSFKTEHMITRSAQKAEYQRSEQNENQFAMLKKYELSREMHVELMNHCRDSKIGFLSTGFDIESLNLLYELGQRLFKIPSGEITNLPYLRHVASFQCPIIMSTGMATLSEIKEAFYLLLDNGLKKNDLSILHCTSSYPTKMADVNLRAMQTIAREFGVRIGYSDHTLGMEVAVAAVALGGTIIEKHFTMDRNLLGPDHKASLEPIELQQMITAIRNLEMAMGDGVKVPTKSELENLVAVRKSIVASTFIKRGESLNSQNLGIKRPGVGISPMLWDRVIGSVAKRDFNVDEQIEI